MNYFFKVFGVLFAVLFGLGAVLQYNDPDSLRWICIYVAASVLCLGFVVGKIRPIVFLLAGLGCFFGFVSLYPANFQGFDLEDGDIKTVELGREAFGLLIIALVMLVFWFRSKKNG